MCAHVSLLSLRYSLISIEAIQHHSFASGHTLHIFLRSSLFLFLRMRGTLCSMITIHEFKRKEIYSMNVPGRGQKLWNSFCPRPGTFKWIFIAPPARLSLHPGP